MWAGYGLIPVGLMLAGLIPMEINRAEIVCRLAAFLSTFRANALP
jgi:hypothetical protein